MLAIAILGLPPAMNQCFTGIPHACLFKLDGSYTGQNRSCFGYLLYISILDVHRRALEGTLTLAVRSIMYREMCCNWQALGWDALSHPAIYVVRGPSGNIHGMPNKAATSFLPSLKVNQICHQFFQLSWQEWHFVVKAGRLVDLAPALKQPVGQLSGSFPPPPGVSSAPRIGA